MTSSMNQPAINPGVAADYDEWSETYDSVENRTRDLAAEVLRTIDLNLQSKSVIEIGCGTGRNTVWLAAAGATGIAALDFSQGMLSRARTRVEDPRVRFVQHDVRTPWPLANASADMVIVMLILEHVENLEPVFAEAARVLRPSGELFICELHPERQLLGKKAEFTNSKTGMVKRVDAFLHLVEDYLSAGEHAGFELIKQADWHDEDSQNPPRLLAVQFRKPLTGGGTSE